MKIIALGDIHGRDIWKGIVEKENDADKVIFIGDYFDTHHAVSANKQIANFNEILRFKKGNADKVVMLMGNHDFHYISAMGESYSGYNAKYALEIEKLVASALYNSHMWYCFESHGYLFSHAGVTKGWCQDHNIDLAHIQSSINRQPLEAFKFDRRDQSNCGNYARQTPIWVRPPSLIANAIDGYHQVVGHTTQPMLSLGSKVDFIDCLETSGEYWKKEF